MNLFNTTILMLPAIAIVGIATSYEDIKYNRIRNVWILFAVAYAFFIFLLQFFILSYFASGVSKEYILNFISNIVLGLFTGIILWLAGLWSAGDAKLFTAYCAIIPLSSYSLGFVRYFPSITLLINTFTPVFVFYISKVIIKTSIKEKKNALTKALKPRTLILVAIGVFAFTWILNPIAKGIALPMNEFFFAAIIFIAMTAFEKIMPFNQKYVIAVIAALRFVFDESIFSLGFLYSFAIVFTTIILLRVFILELSFIYFTKQVYIENLKPGQILAERLVAEGKNEGIIAKRSAMISPLEGLLMSRKKSIVSTGPLTEEDVKKIRRLHSSGKIKQHTISVHEILPFALFLFLGACLTIACSGNAIIFLRILIENFI